MSGSDWLTFGLCLGESTLPSSLSELLSEQTHAINSGEKNETNKLFYIKSDFLKSNNIIY